MSREDYVAIAARLFAVFFAFKIAQQIPLAMQSLSKEGELIWALLVAFVFLLGLAVCVFLWFFPLSIARQLLPLMKEPRCDQTISASVALSLGLTLIGVWIFARGTIDAIDWLVWYVVSKLIDQEGGVVWEATHIAAVLTTVFELGLGAWLIFGNAGIRRLIYKYRYGDYDAGKSVV